MDTIEIANDAQIRWNRVYKSPNTIISKPSSKREQNRGEIRLNSQQRVRGRRKVAASKTPRRPNMNYGTEQRGEHGQYRHKTSGRTSKDHVGKKVEWSKQYAINTKRKQDYLDREAEKAAKNAEFLGSPPSGLLQAEGFYFWSDETLDIYGLLGENLYLLNDIRTTYEVYIDFLEPFSCIRLRSKSLQNIKSGISRIKAKIQVAREDVASHALIYIVEPPSVGAMRTGVSPVFQDSQRVESPSTIVNVVLSGPLLNAQQREAWEAERENIAGYVRHRFSTHMTKGLAELCALNRTMRMRVNYGKLHLNRYRKELKNEGYSFQKFSKMMEESRTSGMFDGVMHGTSVASKILDTFSSASSIFEPTDSLTSHVVDIKAKHSLQVIAHGSSRETVQIEADIDTVQPGVHGKARNDTGWQIGAIRYLSDELNARKKCLGVGLLSVEYNFDSCLEITTEGAIVQPPKAFRRLFENCICGTLTFTTGKSTMVYPAVRLVVPHGVFIDKILVTCALHYKLKETSYIAEVILSHEWDGGNMKKEPSTSCCVSFYHKDWDIFMTARNSIEGLEGVDVHSLFPDESTVDDGIAEFLGHVQTVGKFISHVWDVE